MDESLAISQMLKFARLELDMYGALLALEQDLPDPELRDILDNFINKYNVNEDSLRSLILFLLQNIQAFFTKAYGVDDPTELYLYMQRSAIDVEADPIGFWKRINDEQEST